MMNKRELIKKLCDRPIAFQPAFVPIAGICGALMLSQAIYWSRRTSDPDGWFYKTQKEWQAETGLTRTEQETARQRLTGILHSKLKGVPAKLYYQVDFDALWDRLQDVETPNARLQEPRKPDCGKRANLYTETTAETTAESSVPYGTGAGAPSTELSNEKLPPKHNGELTEDARSQMWRLGVSLLTNQGLAESTARGLIGKWAKQGEKKLAGVIGECAIKPPADARAYINAAMQKAYNLHDEQQLEDAGKAYGVEARPGETWDSFRRRVQDAMRRGKAA